MDELLYKNYPINSKCIYAYKQSISCKYFQFERPVYLRPLSLLDIIQVIKNIHKSHINN